MDSKDDIFHKIKEILKEFFELEEGAVVPDAHLYQDLGLDSLDSIDFAVKFGADIGVKFTDGDLRSIRTVSDIVEVVYQKLDTGKLLEI
jgi:acyl carrier protein